MRSGKTEHPDCSVTGTGPARCLHTKAFLYRQWSAGRTTLIFTVTAVHVASAAHKGLEVASPKFVESHPDHRRAEASKTLILSAAFDWKCEARLCGGL